MLTALHLLSDGAFKLFAYICLTADRRTGRLRMRQAEMARGLGKSRNSIISYLDELSSKGVCSVTPAPNQHQAGEIEVADPFWPYVKEGPSTAITPVVAYVERVRNWLLHYPIFRSSFGEADRKVAEELFDKGVSLKLLERALLLGLARKYVSCLNSTAPSPIYSLGYFLPLLDEVAQTETADAYWDYLRRRLRDFNAAWLDQCRASAAGSKTL
jgi:hypothetical protein